MFRGGWCRARSQSGPDQVRDGDGEALKDALSHEANLDVTMIGVELSPNGVTIAGCLAVEILVTGTGADAVHGGHPEVIGVNTDSADGLIEREFARPACRCVAG